MNHEDWCLPSLWNRFKCLLFAGLCKCIAPTAAALVRPSAVDYVSGCEWLQPGPAPASHRCTSLSRTELRCRTAAAAGTLWLKQYRCCNQSSFLWKWKITKTQELILLLYTFKHFSYILSQAKKSWTINTLMKQFLFYSVNYQGLTVPECIFTLWYSKWGLPDLMIVIVTHIHINYMYVWFITMVSVDGITWDRIPLLVVCCSLLLA